MLYNIQQGLRNIGRNLRLSLASVATITACIFLFCLFFSIVANINNMVSDIESKVGITVFFDETLGEKEIRERGKMIEEIPEVESVEYTSAEEAWEGFKQDYFSGHEDLAEAFAGDNPLKGSSSYTVYLKDISRQEAFARELKNIDGIRQVNYSSSTGEGLLAVGRIISVISGAVTVILLAVALFLISNTISVSAEFRRNETEIMRLIGASNHMIRAPFLIEGFIIGLVGSLLPLAGIYFLYRYAVEQMNEKFAVLSGVLSLVPAEKIMPYMAVSSLILGVGIGFFASLISIRKHLKV